MGSLQLPDVPEILLSAGRPVLLTPSTGRALDANAVLIAWKDAREARRALADALPFLVAARTVLVVETCGDKEVPTCEARTAAVVAGLKRHDVNAQAQVILAPPERIAIELDATAEAIGADLIVAGGYGHSRFGEWILGGVTRDLLRHPERFVLLSH